MVNRLIELIKTAIDEQNRTLQWDTEKETEAQYHERINTEYAWIGGLCYKGNSISWSHSKSVNYGNALLKAWDELTKLGIPCDGNTSVAEAIAKFCTKRSA